MCDGRAALQEDGNRLVLGDFLYEPGVPQDHFLHYLERVIDWEVFGEQLLAWHAGQGEFGRLPYPPESLLKMLLLAYLYHLSERQVEVDVQENLPARWLVGLAADERALDHTTLSAFKARIMARGQEACLQALLAEIIQQAQACEVCLGTVRVVDSANVMAGQAPRDEGVARVSGTL